MNTAGDVNGDGYADFLVSAYGQDTIYLFFGAVGVEDSADLSSADAQLIGELEGDEVGDAVASGAGDFNGDGLDDLAVGVQGASTNAAYMILAPVSGSLGLGTAALKVVKGGGDHVGWAGDLNADGLDDFAFIGVSNGQVALLLGPGVIVPD